MFTEESQSFSDQARQNLFDGIDPAIEKKQNQLKSSGSDQFESVANVTRNALQFIALTFVRTSELIGAKWEEFELDDESMWVIPASRMKKKRKHIVPLCKQSLSLLKKLEAIRSEHDWVFPSYRKPMTHLSTHTMINALYRMGYKNRMTVHGFRSLASTALNEIGFAADIIEKQLSVEDRNEVRSAYNHAEYIHKRKEMMQFWGDYLDKKKKLREDHTVTYLTISLDELLQ